MRFDWLTANPIAHRGYHDLSAGRVENSMSACRAAIAAGFAIESDLQITKDNRVVVFHDSTLNRLTRENGLIRERTAAELAEIHILDSDDTIQTLDQHLAIIRGAVPLLLELKANGGRGEVMVEAIGKSLLNYNGPVAVMSFDHHLQSQFKKIIPDRPRGLTATGDDDFHDFHMKAYADHDLQFVSYDVRDLPNRFVFEIKNRGDVPILAWTVKTPDQMQVSDIYVDQITFEGFDPREIEPQRARDSI